MYKQINVNPKNRKTDDCSTRALSLLIGKSWVDTLKEQCEISIETGYSINSAEVAEKMITNYGYEPGPKLIAAKGSKRPTVAGVAEKFKDYSCLIRCAHHLVASSKGVYVDTWDCGDKAVYKVWLKPLNK